MKRERAFSPVAAAGNAALGGCDRRAAAAVVASQSALDSAGIATCLTGLACAIGKQPQDIHAVDVPTGERELNTNTLGMSYKSVRCQGKTARFLQTLEFLRQSRVSGRGARREKAYLCSREVKPRVENCQRSGPLTVVMARRKGSAMTTRTRIFTGDDQNTVGSRAWGEEKEHARPPVDATCRAASVSGEEALRKSIHRCCFTVTEPKILLLGLGWLEKAQQQKDVVAVEWNDKAAGPSLSTLVITEAVNEESKPPLSVSAAGGTQQLSGEPFRAQQPRH
ncbi:hypothetical protein E2C01_030267 [Portunus trituberculatus]|uniref:Uncharacterized protein n=1 Tax=Portunus trituberculatus TaxID=210409 RepID=A0A5B7EUW6_PORTR|nr:hypothetical protein [Portunus trituberculatus]